MSYELSDAQLNGLARDLDGLYRETQKKMGQEDLDYVRNVKRYSEAIKRRSFELFNHPDTDNAFQKAVVLRGLHVLIEFSVGHVILHGAYDHIEGADEFHSSIYKWDFVIDTDDWKTMHHQGHHPYTNIKGQDHDIGYGLLRIDARQDWWGHNLVQMLTFPALLASHSLYFALYTSYSARAIEGRKQYAPGNYKNAFELLAKAYVKNVVTEPAKTKGRFLQTSVGNFLGTVFGYDYTMLLLLLEHHASNVAMYEKSERTETKGEYYHRQIMATTNFVPFAKLDLFLQGTLAEVDFPNPPDFRVFYAALDTHLEHHMFPDLPDNRLREIVPRVQEIFERYGLPYNIVNFEKTVPDIVGRLFSRTAPVANTQETVLGLLKKPADLTKRLFYGMTYRKPEEPYYMGVLREDKTQTTVVESSSEIGGQARTFRFAIPEKWKKMTWDAGSFISVEVEIDGQSWIRQYSLTHPSEVAETLDITVKRVKDGKVSNYLNDNLKKGDTITLFRKPQGEEGFVMEDIPAKPLFIAGGVGVTPILSMIRKIANEAPETDAQFLYFNRDEGGVLFRDELERLSKTTGLDLRLIYDPLPGAPGHLETSWVSKELLEKHVPDLRERDVYICAPDGFISKTNGYLRELGYDMGRFHMEMFKPPEVKKDQNASYVYHTVRFLKSGKEVRINENTTLLDASRKAGVSVLTGCEKGLCKACVCPKTRGVTQLEGEDPDDFLGKITICNTLPRSDIELDI